jgi:hypothetical protein
LRAEARNQRDLEPAAIPISKRVAMGLHQAVHIKNVRRDAASWGGLIGLTWMTAYWAALIPVWVNYVVVVLCRL